LRLSHLTSAMSPTAQGKLDADEQRLITSLPAKHYSRTHCG